MTTKHTPGPWTMHPSFVDGAEVRSITQVAWCGAASTHGASGSQTINGAEACANARLIAAAPDLLAACEKFIFAFEGDGAETCVVVATDDFADAYDAIEAAIAKAKGQKP